MTDKSKFKEYVIVMKNGHTFTVTADFESLIKKFQAMIDKGYDENFYFGNDVFINIGDISTIHLKLDSDK